MRGKDNFVVFEFAKHVPFFLQSAHKPFVPRCSPHCQFPRQTAAIGNFAQFKRLHFAPVENQTPQFSPLARSQRTSGFLIYHKWRVDSDWLVRHWLAINGTQPVKYGHRWHTGMAIEQDFREIRKIGNAVNLKAAEKFPAKFPGRFFKQSHRGEKQPTFAILRQKARRSPCECLRHLVHAQARTGAMERHSVKSI